MKTSLVKSVFSAALILSSFQAAGAQETDTVAILIDGKSEFDVLYARTSSNSVGAAFGGLLGAGIQASVEADKDVTLRESLEPMIHQEHWQEHFLDALNDRLASKSIEAHWAEKEPETQTDLVLRLKPYKHGFRVVDTNAMLVAAFVEFKYSLNPTGDNQSPDYERAYITNKTSRPLEAFETDEVVVNSDLDEALNRAARRMANKIIYWRP